MLNTTEKLCYTPTELCSLLGLGKNSTYTLINKKDFPKIKIGRRILIPCIALEKWLDSTASREG